MLFQTSSQRAIIIQSNFGSSLYCLGYDGYVAWRSNQMLLLLLSRSTRAMRALTAARRHGIWRKTIWQLFVCGMKLLKFFFFFFFFLSSFFYLCVGKFSARDTAHGSTKTRAFSCLFSFPFLSCQKIRSSSSSSSSLRPVLLLLLLPNILLENQSDVCVCVHRYEQVPIHTHTIIKTKQNKRKVTWREEKRLRGGRRRHALSGCSLSASIETLALLSSLFSSLFSSLVIIIYFFFFLKRKRGRRAVGNDGRDCDYYNIHRA